MRVTREGAPFRPITITIETIDEYRQFVGALSEIRGLSDCQYAKCVLDKMRMAYNNG